MITLKDELKHGYRYGAINSNSRGPSHRDGKQVANYNTSDGDESDTPMVAQYKPYPQRWIVLLAFSFLSFMNNWIWITWSPLTTQVADYWSVPTSSVDDLSAIYMYIYIPLSFPALWFLHYQKLRSGLIVGGCLNTLGALIRYLGMNSYERVYFGTLLCAMCQTLTLAMPPLISTLWFRDNERGLSTSLGVLANQLGSALGLGATIIVQFTNDDDDSSSSMIIDPTKLARYLYSQFIWSAISLGLILLCVRSSYPPTPPSEAAAAQSIIGDDKDEEEEGEDNNSTPTYAESIKMLLYTKSGSSLCLVYGMTVGVLYALDTFLAQLFVSMDTDFDVDDDTVHNSQSDKSDERYWSQEEVGYLGLVLIVVGVFGSLASGEYLDHTRAYRWTSIVLLFGALLSIASFLLLLKYAPLQQNLAYIITGSLGFFLTGFISVGFEYGTAISYPADEAAVAGVMNVAAQIGGWILVIIGGRMMDNMGASSGVDLCLVLVITILASLIKASSLVTAKPRRPIDGK